MKRLQYINQEGIKPILGLTNRQMDAIRAVLSFHIVKQKCRRLELYDEKESFSDIPDTLKDFNYPLQDALVELKDTNEKLYLMYIADSLWSFFQNEDDYLLDWLFFYNSADRRVELYVEKFLESCVSYTEVN